MNRRKVDVEEKAVHQLVPVAAAGAAGASRGKARKLGRRHWRGGELEPCSVERRERGWVSPASLVDRTRLVQPNQIG